MSDLLHGVRRRSSVARAGQPSRPPPQPPGFRPWSAGRACASVGVHDALAFDKDGNLWSFDFGLNLVFAVPAAELAGTGPRSATPLVRISISVAAVLEGLAFDEGGGLWLPYSAGKLARLSPAQLTVSTGSGAPTVPDTIITGSSLGSAQGPAFYPGAKGTPLFHALP